MRRTSQTAIDPAVPHRSPKCLVEPHVRPEGGVDDQGTHGGCSVPAHRPAMALARRQKTSRSMLICGLDQDPSRSEEPRWASSPHAINEFCPDSSRPERRVRDPKADAVRGNAPIDVTAGCLPGGKEQLTVHKMRRREDIANRQRPAGFVCCNNMAGPRASENRCCGAIVHCARKP